MISVGVATGVASGVARAVAGAGGGGSSPAPWTPAALFAASEQGVWYDPSDLSTMFQDSAGTVPVTAVEQPVGLMLDKRLGLVRGPELVTNGALTSGTGWTNAGVATITYSGAGARIVSPANGAPLLSQSYAGAVNKTYVVDAEVVMHATPSAGASVGVNIGGLGENLFVSTQISLIAGNTYRLHGKVRLTSATSFDLRIGSAGGLNYALDFTIRNLSIRELPGNHVSQPTTTARPLVSARKNLLTYSEDFSNAAWTKANAALSGSGASRTVTATANSGSIYQLASSANATCVNSVEIRRVSGSGDVFLKLPNNGATSALALTGAFQRFSRSQLAGGTVNYFVIELATSGDAIEIRYPQAEYGSAITTYQRVTTAADYDTAGFPHYLKFDGVDDFLSTGNINFTSTDKMTVVAGVRSNLNSYSNILELGPDSGSENGFSLQRGFAAAGDYAGIMYGTSQGYAYTSNFAAPDTSVITAQYDIAEPSILAGELAFRRNGVVAAWANATGNAGTGNFTSKPLYIGRRGGTSFPFDGHLYQLVVRGALTTDLAPIEAFTADKAGITL